MKQKKRTTLKDLALYATFIVGLTFCGKSVIGYNNRGDLIPEDFKKANWVEYFNEDGRVWSEYMEANIPHNTTNYYAYLLEVRKKNKGKLEGTILLPKFNTNKKN